jgi:hypothetical protein
LRKYLSELSSSGELQAIFEILTLKQYQTEKCRIVGRPTVERQNTERSNVERPKEERSIVEIQKIEKPKIERPKIEWYQGYQNQMFNYWLLYCG